MMEATKMRPEEPFPLSTAILANSALSLAMWNVALRLVGFLVAA